MNISIRFSLLAVIFAFIMSVECNPRHRYQIVEQASIPYALETSLTSLLSRARDQVNQSITPELKHDAVKKIRGEMFAAYDYYLRDNCKSRKDIREKKKLVKSCWKVLAVQLFKLDKLDMHNSCFTAGIAFPSIIYE